MKSYFYSAKFNINSTSGYKDGIFDSDSDDKFEILEDIRNHIVEKFNAQAKNDIRINFKLGVSDVQIIAFNEV